jgi:hypothetical protein
LLHKDKEKMNTHRTNGTFAFAPTHKANPSAKSKEPFFILPHYKHDKINVFTITQ